MIQGLSPGLQPEDGSEFAHPQNERAAAARQGPSPIPKNAKGNQVNKENQAGKSGEYQGQLKSIKEQVNE